ncbi:sugar transferase [Aurantiacibacter rhizosphaerae]|uniref:Sugar transferase n=1 Tax=Aurantiacibacter rhizosphaerae TaxID=2691582 RepID=A0A844XAV0_9SPHN|nr:sugar transferase [Aurantiacibacter rhizosphaerae]MWV26960.1 sugar transferase [Aurantiacibacter rhizosphaerae]
MYQIRLDGRHVHRSLFHSLRVQFATTLVASILVPLAIFVVVRGPVALEATATYNTLTISFLAALSTLLALRRVGSYFGLVLAKWILPVYGTSFAAFTCFPLLLRTPYTTTLMVLCFVCGVLSLFLLVLLMSRGKRAVCFVVPRGRALNMEFSAGLETIVLEHPRLPRERNAILVADLHAPLGEEWERLLTEAALEGHPVYHVTQLREAMTGQVQLDHLSENSFGALLPTLAYKKIKRLVDLCATIVMFPLLALVMFFIAVAIRLDSPGPALFSQRRMGYQGRIFEIIKFRTMTVREDGENAAASMTAADDQRITRLGKHLRRTRLDELPQLFNILRGEMSWIGPRPEAVSLSSLYASKISNYRYRHLVRPGITGWAQVHQGHVTSVDDIHDKLRYDFYYVKNISFWLDVVIVFRTIKVMITGFGAR